MIAPRRRSSARVLAQSVGFTRSSTPSVPMSQKSNRSRAVRSSGIKAVANTSDSETETQIAKRRRTTRTSSSQSFHIEIPESSQPQTVTVAAHSNSTSNSTSASGSGSESASPRVFDTPATSLSDANEPKPKAVDDSSDEELTELSDREEFVPAIRQPSRAAKGKGKAKVEIPDSEEEDDCFVDDEDDSDEYDDGADLPAKGKGRAKKLESDSEDDIPLMKKRFSKRTAIVSDESEFEGALEDTDDDSDGDQNSVQAPVAAVPGSRPVNPTPTPATGRRGRGGRRANWMASRADRDREKLYIQHPELRTVWDDYEKKAKIPVVQAPQPAGLSLTLLPFQREGLHWLQEQEKTEFRGGILADEMGMGKTIQTISLLMTDLDAKPNLVVAPTVALMQWRSEIEKYTGGRLKVNVYHGANRNGKPADIVKFDVVLTTYNILESDYRKQHHGFKRKAGIFKEDSPLHKIKFYRVVLDEAHNIKDRSCNTAKAVYALQTQYKLCLSGTPLQNRIGELFSLLRFLEVDPFAYYYCRNCTCKELHWKFEDGRHCNSCGHSPMNHVCFFNYELLKPIQRSGNEGEGAIAFGNIHKLMKCIMLRRTKTEREEDLGLPPKVVRIRRDRFSEEELDLYDSIYSDGKRRFDTYVAQGVVLNNYANIFTLITRMRQMADHPDLVLRKQASDESESRTMCHLCIEPASDAIKSKCHHIFCRECISTYVSSSPEEKPTCPKCHVVLSIDLSAPAIEDEAPTKGAITSRINPATWRSSTKIEALCDELMKLRTTYSSPKSIVFSSFTSFLALLEFRLHSAGFKTVLLSGTMSPTQREASINHFMKTPDVEVFLVSLKAGGVALNLTEANNVFVMEPWWNPSVEWQAADRIHRIGQQRRCTITRMVVEGSIEGRIVELQEKKSRLIQATVDHDQKAVDKLTVADMQFLFQN